MFLVHYNGNMEMQMEKEMLARQGGGATDANDVVAIQNTIRTSRSSSVFVDAERSRSVEARDPSEEIQLLKSPVSKGRIAHFTEQDEEEKEYSELQHKGDEDDDEYGEEREDDQKRKSKLWGNPFALIEFVAFACIMALLISSLTFKQLQTLVIWDFRMWRWCVLVTAIFSGRLVAKWFVNFLLSLIQRLTRRFRYILRRVRKNLYVLIWLVFVLLASVLLFQSKEGSKFKDYSTRALAASIAGAALWLLKSVSVQSLAVSFQSKRFFSPIAETVFDQYLLLTLSGPPVMDIYMDQLKGEDTGVLEQTSFEKKKKEETYVIDMGKLGKMKRQKVSTWTMKMLIDLAERSKLSICSSQLDGQCVEQEEEEENEGIIKSELQAEYAADKIFANVARPGYDCIKKEDLLRFLNAEEVSRVLTLFPGAARNGKIPKSELKKWAVKVYCKRKALSHFIQQSKSATQELDRLFSGVVIVVIIILWLILMGFLSTQALVFIISQIVLAAFMFGNTAKNTFESVIFLYVMHPFDVGDRCIIDGVEMVVDEIHILTTTFIRYDNEKLFYPNSVLATKPVTNYQRSTRKMRDTIEFSIDVSTSVETIEALSSRIQDYLNSKPEHWRARNKVVVKEIEGAEKIRMVLYVSHTINFQDYEERSSRRSELVLQLKKVFEELGISKYHVLPKSQVSSVASAVPQPVS